MPPTNPPNLDFTQAVHRQIVLQSRLHGSAQPDIRPGSLLSDDLGLASLDLVEILCALGSIYQSSSASFSWDSIKTVDDLCRELWNHFQQQRSPAAPDPVLERSMRRTAARRLR
jgi:acyl carrier protein